MQCSAKRPHRFNALKHGVLSRYTVLPWEDAEEYRALVSHTLGNNRYRPANINRSMGTEGKLLWRSSPQNVDLLA